MFEPIISPRLIEDYLSRGKYSRSEIHMFDEVADSVYRSLTVGKQPRPVGQQAELLNIVGPPGAGKTTLLREMLKRSEKLVCSVAIDPDLIRTQLPFFREAIDWYRQSGLTIYEADQRTKARWYNATVYVVQTLFNRAQKEGYNLIRLGTMSGTVTTDICLRAKKAAYQLTSAVILAPESICRLSIDRRMQEGGHPTREEYFNRAFDEIKPSLDLLQERSDKLQLFWRSSMTSLPVLVAEINSSQLLTIHDLSHLESLRQLTGLNMWGIVSSANPERPLFDSDSPPRTLG